MNWLADVTVLVLGLGESGLAMARWCARCGATVRAWDSRAAAPNAAALTELVPAAVIVEGPLTAEAFDGVRLVLKSPGLSPRDERIAGPLRQAVERGVPVQGELDLFARALADLKETRGYAPKVIAITGTNGKTTTTAMAALIVERAGRRVAMAGNIGPTMLQTLADRLDLDEAAAPRPHLQCASSPAGEDRSTGSPHAARKPCLAPRPLPEGEGGKAAAPGVLLPLPLGEGWGEGRGPLETSLPEVWILELSSFQLDAVQSFEPSAAAVLNLSEDHLDWHGDMTAYAAAKARVFGGQAVIVVNRDDPAVERLVPSPVSAPGPKAKQLKAAPRHVVRFGLDAPRRPGDYGLVVDGGMAWLARALEADDAPKRGRRDAAEPDELHIQRLMPADALRVRGRHNAANALAALALATAIGCPLAPLLHGLRDYAGEPHRVEWIATVGGVDAFDDSKGTNVGATVAALDGLGADKASAKLVVILGGDGKGQDFMPLAAPVRRHARAVATLGRDAERIEAALAASGVRMQRHASLEAATRWGFEQAEAGDAVLLSPACASLDMFRDYAHRAEVFVREVHALAAERGEVLA